MIATVFITMGIALLAMLPGVLLLRGGKTQTGQYAAAATASLVAMMLLTALLGEISAFAGFGELPSATILLASVTSAIISWWVTRGHIWSTQSIEWQGLCLAAAFFGFALFSQALSVREDSSGALLIHAWYNADWFKHLGHVAALADFGVPARDAFNHGAPLHYYWLSYILPGAGAALGGDNWAALYTANSIITILFCFTFYGTVRTVAGPSASLIATLLSLFICAPINIAHYLLTQPAGITGLLNGPSAPNGPALMALAQYIPQHALTLAVLLAWISLNRPGSDILKGLRFLTLAALASAMTLSTLLGAMVLGAYGLISLWNRRLSTLPELIVMAVISGLLVVLLGVIQIGDPASAITSPLLDNPPDPQPALYRIAQSAMTVIGHVGLPLLVAIFVLHLWTPTEDSAIYGRRVAIVLMVTAIAAAIAAELILTRRLGIETRIRAVNLPGISVAIIGAWAISHYCSSGTRERLVVIGIGLFLTAAAAPSIYVRTIWHFNMGDRFTTKIPKDDRTVLTWLGRNSESRAIVWQYPEPPVLANPSGNDAWAAVFGGRAVTGSLRATDYASTIPYLHRAEKYFAGEQVPIPANASWVYLSRVLHPKSYDTLLVRLEEDFEWRKRACYPDACLFSRIAAQ